MSQAIRLPLLGAALALAGCAAVAPAPAPGPRLAAADCAARDWRAAGLEAALAGEPAADGLARIAACPALAGGPTAREAAEDAFLSGHDEGRAAYCTPENARALARRGARPSLACPPHMEAAFARAWAAERAAPRPGDGGGYRPRVTPSVSLGLGIGDGGVRTGLGLGIVLR